MSCEAASKRKNQLISINWDRLGIAASGLCAVHCVAAPILFTLFPAYGMLYLRNHNFHPPLALLVIVISFFAFRKGYRQNHEAMTAVLGMAGTLLVVIGAFHLVHFDLYLLESMVTISGTALLIYAHLRNWKLTRQQAHPHHH